MIWKHEFFSAEKEDDNLIRVVSEEIAQELIGMESGSVSYTHLTLPTILG